MGVADISDRHPLAHRKKKPRGVMIYFCLCNKIPLCIRQHRSHRSRVRRRLSLTKLVLFALDERARTLCHRHRSEIAVASVFQPVRIECRRYARARDGVRLVKVGNWLLERLARHLGTRRRSCERLQTGKRHVHRCPFRCVVPYQRG